MVRVVRIRVLLLATLILCGSSPTSALSLISGLSTSELIGTLLGYTIGSLVTVITVIAFLVGGLANLLDSPSAGRPQGSPRGFIGDNGLKALDVLLEMQLVVILSNLDNSLPAHFTNFSDIFWWSTWIMRVGPIPEDATGVKVFSLSPTSMIPDTRMGATRVELFWGNLIYCFLFFIVVCILHGLVYVLVKMLMEVGKDLTAHHRDNPLPRSIHFPRFQTYLVLIWHFPVTFSAFSLLRNCDILYFFFAIGVIAVFVLPLPAFIGAFSYWGLRDGTTTFVNVKLWQTQEDFEDIKETKPKTPTEALDKILQFRTMLVEGGFWEGSSWYYTMFGFLYREYRALFLLYTPFKMYMRMLIAIVVAVAVGVEYVGASLVFVLLNVKLLCQVIFWPYCDRLANIREICFLANNCFLVFLILIRPLVESNSTVADIGIMGYLMIGVASIGILARVFTYIAYTTLLIVSMRQVHKIEALGRKVYADMLGDIEFSESENEEEEATQTAAFALDDEEDVNTKQPAGAAAKAREAKLEAIQAKTTWRLDVDGLRGASEYDLHVLTDNLKWDGWKMMDVGDKKYRDVNVFCEAQRGDVTYNELVGRRLRQIVSNTVHLNSPRNVHIVSVSQESQTVVQVDFRIYAQMESRALDYARKLRNRWKLGKFKFPWEVIKLWVHGDDFLNDTEDKRKLEQEAEDDDKGGESRNDRFQRQMQEFREHTLEELIDPELIQQRQAREQALLQKELRDKRVKDIEIAKEVEDDLLKLDQKISKVVEGNIGDDVDEEPVKAKPVFNNKDGKDTSKAVVVAMPRNLPRIHQNLKSHRPAPQRVRDLEADRNQRYKGRRGLAVTLVAERSPYNGTS